MRLKDFKEDNFVFLFAFSSRAFNIFCLFLYDVFFESQLLITLDIGVGKADKRKTTYFKIFFILHVNA